jgi:hypothetical protein
MPLSGIASPILEPVASSVTVSTMKKTPGVNAGSSMPGRK